MDPEDKTVDLPLYGILGKKTGKNKDLIEESKEITDARDLLWSKEVGAVLYKRSRKKAAKVLKSYVRAMVIFATYFTGKRAKKSLTTNIDNEEMTHDAKSIMHNVKLYSRAFDIYESYDKKNNKTRTPQVTKDFTGPKSRVVITGAGMAFVNYETPDTREKGSEFPDGLYKSLEMLKRGFTTRKTFAELIHVARFASIPDNPDIDVTKEAITNANSVDEINDILVPFRRGTFVPTPGMLEMLNFKSPVASRKIGGKLEKYNNVEEDYTVADYMKFKSENSDKKGEKKVIFDINNIRINDVYSLSAAVTYTVGLGGTKKENNALEALFNQIPDDKDVDDTFNAAILQEASLIKKASKNKGFDNIEDAALVKKQVDNLISFSIKAKKKFDAPKKKKKKGSKK
jgi:hypothetical protein